MLSVEWLRTSKGLWRQERCEFLPLFSSVKESPPMSTCHRGTDFHCSAAAGVWPCETFVTCYCCTQSAAAVATFPSERAFRISDNWQYNQKAAEELFWDPFSLGRKAGESGRGKKIEQEKSREIELCYWLLSCYVTLVATETSECKRKHEWKTRLHTEPHN